MNLGLLPAIARLHRLLSTHGATRRGHSEPDAEFGEIPSRSRRKSDDHAVSNVPEENQ